MIFLEGGEAPKYQHSDFMMATREAERLAELTGKKAFVLCSIASVKLADKFQKEDLRPEILKDELPF